MLSESIAAMAPFWVSLGTNASAIGRAAVEVSRRVGGTLFFQVPHYTRWGLYPQVAVLVACYAYWQLFPIIPGASIAVLAFVAVIMTVRADKFSAAERVVWVVLGFAIMVFEIRTLYLDRQNNDEQHLSENRKQQQEFEATLREFERQSGQVNSVLETTRGVASLAKKSLESVTGGDSYAFAVPDNYEGHNILSISIRNAGRNPLTGIEVRISEVLSDTCKPNEKKCPITLDLGQMYPIAVGNLSGRGAEILPRPIDAGTQEKPKHYQIRISAQNGYAIEDLRFRSATRGFAYKFTVYKSVSTNATFGTLIKPVRSVDWTDPIKPQPQ